VNAKQDREITLLARKCALLEGFVEGCGEGSGDADWLTRKLGEPGFREAYIRALHERIWELEGQLRADQIAAAKRAVLLGE